MRVLIVALVALAGCKIELNAAKGDASPAGSTPVETVPPSRCDPAVDHWASLVATETKAAVPATDVADSKAQCTREAWSPTILDCLEGAKSASEVERVCYKLAFTEKRIDVTPKRTFAVDDPAVAKLTPAMFSQDGDTATFENEGKKCAITTAQRGPGAAAFIVCNGEVLAGPLTSKEEMKQAVTIVTNARRATMAKNAPAGPNGYDLARSVRLAWPSGGPTQTVYDSATGRPLYQTF